MVDPSVYMQSIKIMIDDPDTDIVIIDAELPKAPHELRERNLRIVNEMAGAASKPVVYISAMSIGFTEFTKALAQIAAEHRRDAGNGPRGRRDQVADRIRLAAQGGAGYRVEFVRFRARDAGEDAEERQGRGARRGRVEGAAQGLRHSGLEGSDRADRRGRRRRSPRRSAFPSSPRWSARRSCTSPTSAAWC